MNKPLNHGLFITGTDTGCGKTYIGSRLAQFLYANNYAVVPRKPVESGCAKDNNALIPEDALAYYLAIEKSQSLETICPYRFTAALAPPRAAKLSGSTLYLQQLINACQTDPNHFLLVEGAGGFYSPIAEDGLNADLAQALSLPVLLVSEDKLGCINQVLLAVEAVKLRQLKLKGIVLNRIHNDIEKLMENAIDLRQWVDVDCKIYTFDSEKDTAAFWQQIV